MGGAPPRKQEPLEVMGGGNYKAPQLAYNHCLAEVIERVSSTSDGSDGEREEEGEGGEREDEKEKENAKLWGPLKKPVQVKIADLGNACWVVSEVVLMRGS